MSMNILGRGRITLEYGRSPHALSADLGVFLILSCAAVLHLTSALGAECPPSDPSIWKVSDVYAECDPYDGSDGRKTGTNGNKCMQLQAHDAGAQSKACYQRIDDCLKEIWDENKKVFEHNNLVRRCKSGGEHVAQPAADEAPSPCKGADLEAAQASMAHAKKAIDSAISALRSPTAAQSALAEKWLGTRSSSEAAAVESKLVRARAFADGATFLCTTKFMHHKNSFGRR
jgi:hypothetical protein